MENEKLKDKPKLTVVPKRSVPTTPSRPAPGIYGFTLTLATQIALSTDSGQYAYNESMDVVNEVDLALGEAVDHAVEQTIVEFDKFKDDMDGYGSNLITVGETAYGELKEFINNIVNPITYGPVADVQNDQYSFKVPGLYNLNMSVSQYPHTIESHIGFIKREETYMNSTYIAHYVYVISLTNSPSPKHQGHLIEFNDNEYVKYSLLNDSIGNLSHFESSTSIEKLLPRILDLYYLNLHSNPSEDYSDQTSLLDNYITNSGIVIPPIPYYNEVPAIVSIDDTKYWEIEQNNPDFDSTQQVDPWNNPEKIIEYVPVNDPTSEPIPSIVPNPNYVTDPGTDIVEIPEYVPPTNTDPMPEPSEPYDPVTTGYPLPVNIFICFFDLIRASVWFILRFVQFIVNIANVPEKPIDNPAFHWFKNTKFLGVYIYHVVMTFATIGLSLSVYKVVRKVVN